MTLRLLRALFEARKVARTFCGDYLNKLPDRLWYKFRVDDQCFTLKLSTRVVICNAPLSFVVLTGFTGPI